VIAYKVARRTADPEVFRSAMNDNPVRVKRSRSWWVPSRQYKIGRMTRAHSTSLGIFCFYLEGRAKRFAMNIPRSEILRVEGLGDPTEPSWIDGGFKHPIFRCTEVTRSVSTPDGTVCFPRVRTLGLI